MIITEIQMSMTEIIKKGVWGYESQSKCWQIMPKKFKPLSPSHSKDIFWNNSRISQVLSGRLVGCPSSGVYLPFGRVLTLNNGRASILIWRQLRSFRKNTSSSLLVCISRWALLSSLISFVSRGWESHWHRLEGGQGGGRAGHGAVILGHQVPLSILLLIFCCARFIWWEGRRRRRGLCQTL